MQSAGSTPLETRAALTDRRERMLFVILRNAIPLIGVFFLGWSATNLVILYFVDTLGAMWALFTAMALHFQAASSAPTLFGRLGNYATMLFVGAFLVAFMAIPLGMPLFIYAMVTDWDWQQALNDQGFMLGILSIAALSLAGMLRHYQNIQELTIDRAPVKRDFAILMTRWFIVLIVIYTIGLFLGPWGAYVMVLAYAGATIASEIYPDRFSNLIGPMNSKRYEPPPPTEEETNAIKEKARQKRKRKKRRV
jgi:hypothetical protein